MSNGIEARLSLHFIGSKGALGTIVAINEGAQRARQIAGARSCIVQPSRAR
jgi:hypothetical protein